MTHIDTPAIRAAAAEASQGEWRESGDFKKTHPNDPDSYVFAHGCGPQIGTYRPSMKPHYEAMMDQMLKDARFIALANPQTVTALLDQLDAAKARVTKLEEGLKPFAECAEHDIGEDEADNDPFRNCTHNRAPRIIVGHLRRARALLNERTE